MNKDDRERRKLFEAKLAAKRIYFEHITERAETLKLKAAWRENFTKEINTQGIYINDYLWHIFSYDRQIYAEGGEADLLFLTQGKKECYLFFQHEDDAYFLKNAEDLTQPDFLPVLTDIYIVNKRFNWTYVVTHESNLGPYFYHKKMSKP